MQRSVGWPRARGYARLSGIIFLVFISLPSVASALPSFNDVKSNYQSSDAVLLDRHGTVIHELRRDMIGRRLEWTGIDRISPALLRAVVHSEDKRFYQHAGVDWMAIGSAAAKGVVSRSPRGASTITMQLASILNKDLRPKQRKRSYAQKWNQISAARDLEKGWSKNEIFEAYLNLITFRGELQGVSAAARGLFDKDPHGLDAAEAFILAALIRAPNAPVADVVRRAALLAAEGAPLQDHTIRATAEKALTGVYHVRQRIAYAPHVAHAVLKKGIAVSGSTLDADLQQFTLESLRHQVGLVRAQNVTDGAVLVVENKTGDILAYVGNIGSSSPAPFVDGVEARRQAGSTLKPFLYGLAFEKKILTPASLLHDSPLDIPTEQGIYKPENYEHDFKGLVSARTALASSLNIPAVRVIGLAGSDDFIEKLRELGFEQLEADDFYGPSAALGSVDVSLRELVNAYRTLANGGIRSPLQLLPGQTKKKGRPVFSADTAFLISDILSDRQARSLTFGLENPLATRFWSAVKTGTSKDMRDNWCIGYSARYTVGVWVGNFSGRPMWNVSGITGAAPVWLEIMNRLQNNRPGTPPRRPESVVSQRIEFGDDIEVPRFELFNKGTEPLTLVARSSEARPGILYPAEGSIIAIDPDIPDDHQRIFFEAGVADGRLHWMLNGEYWGEARADAVWRPQQGRYILALADENNVVVDSVRFEVRGGK
ncbi:MAG: penicillin-binding protein 1C [Thermodesulfovibrio sp.]|nr:penicillin-binding protein 1C [Thermodesulfovibrio sp.]